MHMRADTLDRISICQFSTYRWNFFEDVLRYAAHGFNSMGVWRRKLDDFGLDAAADLLFEMKMNVSSIHWAGGFTGDGQTFKSAIEDAFESIQITSRLNAGCLIVHPGSRNGHTTTHAKRLWKSALQKILPVASDFGVQIAIEPVLSKAPSSWTFQNSLAETLQTLQEFPSANLGIALDMYEVGLDPTVFESLQEFASRIKLVQFSDRCGKEWENQSGLVKNESNRLPIGKGDVQFDRWLATLQELGYHGNIEVEIHNGSAESEYADLLSSTRSFFTSQKIRELTSISKSAQRT
jgi:sugar phosphate isomerase/epimerase